MKTYNNPQTTCMAINMPALMVQIGSTPSGLVYEVGGGADPANAR